MGQADDLQPGAVVLEVAEGQVPEAGVLVVADVVVDAGAGAVVALDGGDVSLGLVGEDRLEGVPVEVGERQLDAMMRAVAAHQHPGFGWPAGQVEVLGDLGDVPAGRWLASWSIAPTQVRSGISSIAARTGSVRSNPTL